MGCLGLALVIAVCLATGVFIAGDQPATAKWEGNINVDKLGKYLSLSANQQGEVANIYGYFDERMLHTVSSKKSQEKLVCNVVYGNLKSMKRALNGKQYADYAKVLDVTLQDKRTEVE